MGDLAAHTRTTQVCQQAAESMALAERRGPTERVGLAAETPAYRETIEG
jgi:hypothetical protein